MTEQTSSHRRFRRPHRHLLCRRLRLPLRLLEGGRQLPTDQKGPGRDTLDVFCSCPMVRLVAFSKRRHPNGGRIGVRERSSVDASAP